MMVPAVLSPYPAPAAIKDSPPVGTAAMRAPVERIWPAYATPHPAVMFHPEAAAIPSGSADGPSGVGIAASSVSEISWY